MINNSTIKISCNTCQNLRWVDNCMMENCINQENNYCGGCPCNGCDCFNPSQLKNINIRINYIKRKDD